MPVTVYERATQIIATDYVAMFKQLSFPLCRSGFEDMFVRLEIEAIFFAGSSLKQGFLVGHVRQCLEVAAAYLCLGCNNDDISSLRAVEFGLFLCTFLYYTQPTKAGIRSQIDVTMSILNHLADVVTQLPHLQPLLKALLEDNALHVAPAVNNSIAMRAVLVAHALHGAALITPKKEAQTSIMGLVGVEEEGNDHPSTVDIRNQWAKYQQQSKGIIR